MGLLRLFEPPVPKPPGQSIGPPHHEQSFSERLILVPASLLCNLPEEVCFLTLNLMDENLAPDHKPAPRKAERPLNQRKSRSKPAWTDVKAKLAGLDRLGLMGLIQDLYAFQKDNQTFLHTRFGLSGDVLKPYKQTLERWLSPDVLRNQDTSVSKAKQAISAYRKAIGDHAGLAELMVFYCENAAGFCSEFGNPDEDYLDALLRMFEQALTVGRQLPAEDRDALMLRLDSVRTISHDLGYGIGDAMDYLLEDHAGN